MPYSFTTSRSSTSKNSAMNSALFHHLSSPTTPIPPSWYSSIRAPGFAVGFLYTIVGLLWLSLLMCLWRPGMWIRNRSLWWFGITWGFFVEDFPCYHSVCTDWRVSGNLGRARRYYSWVYLQHSRGILFTSLSCSMTMLTSSGSRVSESTCIHYD